MTEREETNRRHRAAMRAAESARDAAGAAGDGPARDRHEADRLAARNRLVGENYSLCWGYARREFRAGRVKDVAESAQDAALGLLRAAESWEPETAAFSTYAALWMRNAVRRPAVDAACLIRLPAHQWGNLFRYNRARAAAVAAGRPDDREAFVKALGLTGPQEADFRDALEALARGVVAGSDHVERGSGSSTVEVPTVQALARDPSPGPPERAARSDEIAAVEAGVRAALRSVPARDAAIFVVRRGLFGADTMTLEEVGAELGVSRERVRQIETRVFRRVAAHFGAPAPEPKPRRKRAAALPSPEPATA